MNIIATIVIFLTFAIGIQIFVWSFFLLRFRKTKYAIAAFFCGLLLIFIPVLVVLASLQSPKCDGKSARQTAEKLNTNGVSQTGTGASSPR
jgi:hypothetical protein